MILCIINCSAFFSGASTSPLSSRISEIDKPARHCCDESDDIVGRSEKVILALFNPPYIILLSDKN